MFQVKVTWSAIVVLLVAMGIVAYKVSTKRAVVAAPVSLPRILLVADLSEADSADACAEIIRSVRAARDRGVSVEELNADSKSELLRRYRVLTVPTVLVLDDKGQVASRFEGEEQSTVDAVQNQLAKLTK